MHWGRALVGGICAELTALAIVFPVLHFFGETAFFASILVSSAALPLIFAVWVDARVDSDFIVHGLLVGVVAVSFCLIAAWGQPEPFLYQISHGLKLVGGFLGGATSSRLAHSHAQAVARSLG